MGSQQLLDQAYSRPRLDELAAEPGAYAARLDGELPAAYEAAEPGLADALSQIDAVAARAMRVELEHADVGLGAPTRNVFATTVVAYAGNLGLLAQRAHDAAARGRTGDPDRVAEIVVDGARYALGLREALRAGVLALVVKRAAAAIADADRNARDRKLDEVVRRRSSALRRELEVLAVQPERIATVALAKRLAAWPAQLDEPDPVAEPTFAEMIEID